MKMSLFDLNNPWSWLDENSERSAGDKSDEQDQLTGSTLQSFPAQGSGSQYSTPQSVPVECSGRQYNILQKVPTEGSGDQYQYVTLQNIPTVAGSGGQHNTFQNQDQYIGQMEMGSVHLNNQDNKEESNFSPDLNNFMNIPPVSDQPPDEILAPTEEEMVSPVLLQPMTKPVRVAPEEPSHVSMPDTSHTMNVGPQESPLSMMHQQQVGLPVSNSQPLSTFQNTGTSNILFLATSLPQQSTPLAIMPQQQTHLTPVSQKGGGVVDVPALTDMEGEYCFSVTIEEKERTTKSPMWLMSKITKKLYTNINKAVPFEIRLKKEVPREFHIRAVTVFSSAQFLRKNVTRCPNHASPADVTNHDFPYPAHVLRADHPKAEYEKSPNGRLSVVVPLDILQDGSDYTPILLRFMCLGSCVGGINRRPIAIILTLENNAGQLFGRKVIDVRVCACPTRDIRTDEQTLMNKGVKRRGSSVQDKPQLVIRKKPKTAIVEPKSEPPEDDKLFYIPVRGQKLYDFLSDIKDVYLRTHPEYAAKYPDDCRSFQIEDDSDDELKGNTLQRLGSGDSETVNWDSGGDSPPRTMFNNDSHLDTLSGTKNNSPLSKLTPNISISPPPTKLRLWHEETDNEVIGFSQGESLDYPPITKAQSTDVILNSSKSASNSINSESVNPKSSVQHPFIKNMDFSPKHIPVMQVQSYRPGGSTLKTKSFPVLKYTIQNQYVDDRSNKNNEKKNTRGNYSSLDPSEMSYGQSTGEDYLSPGSPEMLAANVLVEGFKAKTMTKQ